MNREDIIRMAREAGLQHKGELFVPDAFSLRFAALVAAAAKAEENEACAKVCEEEPMAVASRKTLAAAIRARGNNA